MKLYRVRLPRIFYCDRSERGLPVGLVVYWPERGNILVDLTPDELADYLDDAEFYANPKEEGLEPPPGLATSARHTTRALRVALSVGPMED